MNGRQGSVYPRGLRRVPEADRYSRRLFLQRAALLCLSAPSLAAFLAACMGDDDEEPSEPTVQSPTVSDQSVTATVAGTDSTAPTVTGTRSSPTQRAVSNDPVTPVEGHPRIWVRAEDLPRLRSWASESNPVYSEALLPLAEQGKADMDSGVMEDGDDGSEAWVPYPIESYAQLFAFMSLIVSDEGERNDYAERARTLLMTVITEAAKGSSGEDLQRFRTEGFGTRDRSRWWGESFGLTVDWIYPYLSAEEKATIREVFLRWCDENINAAVTGEFNHPQPQGLTNDPQMTNDPLRLRWSLNNYYTAHMRNMAMMTLCLDPADDPDGQLTGLLENVTGAWLYTVDAAIRDHASGGLAPEGFEYSPQAMGYVVQTLLALHTAGQADASRWGNQVKVENLSYWDEMIPALLNSVSPLTVEHEWYGPVYQPAWYGDGQNYWGPDHIGVFGPLGAYDQLVGNIERLNAARWFEQHIPPGGPEQFPARVAGVETRPEAILYFLLFDPEAPEPADPRPNLPTNWYAPGIRRILSRTDWSPEAAWFTWGLGWQTIDHQHGDGLAFEFYRDGEWLTKERTGYGENISASDYHNTLAIQNGEWPRANPDDYRYPLSVRGSQWTLNNDDPPGGQVLGVSLTDSYIYALGDATALYNSTYEEVTEVTHASRSIIWLKPDIIVTYDRASTATDGLFKRYWLQLPFAADVDGNLSTMTTDKGQQMFVTTLLPADASIVNEDAEPLEEDNEPAFYDPIRYRLKVEAPGDPADTRFFHVVQGADAGTDPLPVELIESTDGAAYTGALVDTMAVLFPVAIGEVQSLTYAAPTSATTHYVTGLSPNGPYDVGQQVSGEMTTVTITAGGSVSADPGGVLVIDTSSG